MQIKRTSFNKLITPAELVKAFAAVGYTDMTVLAINQDTNQYLWHDAMNGLYGVNAAILEQSPAGIVKAELSGNPVHDWSSEESGSQDFNIDGIAYVDQLQHFIDDVCKDMVNFHPEVLAINAKKKTFLWFNEYKAEYMITKYVIDDARVWVVMPPLEVWPTKEPAARSDDTEYEDSAEFTDDLTTLSAVLKRAMEIIATEKFAQWVKATDNHYGSNMYDPFREVRDNVAISYATSKAFERDFINLDN